MTAENMLDPEIAAAVEAMVMPALSDEVVGMIRRVDMPSMLTDDVTCFEHTLPGDPPLAIRVYRPREVSGPLPCLYWIHGGGYVVGRASMADDTFSELSPRLGLVGVSIEYRLAPDTPYPGPLEDCYRGLKWTHEQSATLGIDPARIGVGGISAGGGLAAALALLVRDRAEIPVAFQLLDCPMIDDRQFTASSQVDGLPVWSRESNAFGWRSYLGALYGTDEIPATAAPARAEDLSGLPPAFISVGTVDGFLDEDVDYAMRLNRAGVAAELHVYPGACHGYQLAKGSRIVKQSQRDLQGWLAFQIGAERR